MLTVISEMKFWMTVNSIHGALTTAIIGMMLELFVNQVSQFTHTILARFVVTLNYPSLDDPFPAVTNLQILRVGPSSITVGWDVSKLSVNSWLH